MANESAATGAGLYTQGDYLSKHPTWHMEDSPFKADQVLKMLARHPELNIRSVCEIGCGAGAILSELQKLMPQETIFKGYEISPQAHAISKRFENARCRYVLGDAFADSDRFDLVLLMDVIEHVEDCFDFLRKARQKGRYTIAHIPLTHASAVLRGVDGKAWDTVGHIHIFTLETAPMTLAYAGHRVIDQFQTAGAIESPNRSFRTRVANLARRLLMRIAPKMTVRLIGGYSLLILSE